MHKRNRNGEHWRRVKARRAAAGLKPPGYREEIAALPPYPDSRYVPLTKGQWAIVDACHYESVMRYRWRAHLKDGIWYAVSSIAPGRSLHRFLMGAGAGDIVDHRDHDGLHNRLENLRLCSSRQNSFNSSVHRDKRTAKLKGVYGLPDGRFQAQITVAYKKYNLGKYATEEEAGAAYSEAAKKLHGEFAYVPPSQAALPIPENLKPLPQPKESGQ